MKTNTPELCTCCGCENCNCNCKQRDVLHVIKSRRAVRKYKTQAVEAGHLEQILEAAVMAPSAMDRQPWKLYVLQDAAKVKKLSEEILKKADTMYHYLIIKMTEVDPVFHGAPAVIFITGKKKDEWSPIAIGLCAQNLMLAAKSLGYDTCPIGFARMVQAVPSYRSLNIPDAEQVELAIALGVGDEVPTMHPRKAGAIVYI